MRRAILLIALMLGTVIPASAHVRLTTDDYEADAAEAFWPINASGPKPGIKDHKVVYHFDATVPEIYAQAIEQAFLTWENIPDCQLAFVRGSNTSGKSVGFNLVNDIFFADNATEGNGYLNTSGVLAVTIPIYTGLGELFDADMIFKNFGGIQWSTTLQSGRYDVQGVAAHEIGHFIGLNHTFVGGATMFPYARAAEFFPRDLDMDDQVGAREIYPRSSYVSTTLSGQLTTNSGATDIVGVQAFLTDASGRVTAADVSDSNGTYSITGLYPGSYTAGVLPLQPDGIGTMFTSLGNLGMFGNNTNVGLLKGTIVAVNAGGNAQSFDLPAGSTGSNVNGAGTSFSVSSGPIVVTPGQTVNMFFYLDFGSSAWTMNIDGIGTAFATSTPQHFQSDYGIGGWIYRQVEVLPTAPEGSYSVWFTGGSIRTMFPGAIVVRANATPTPNPGGSAILPATSFPGQILLVGMLSLLIMTAFTQMRRPEEE